MTLNEDQIDTEIENIKKEVSVTGAEIINKLVDTDKDNVVPVQNKGSKISLGELGSFDCVTPEEVEEVFNKINGFVFKIKKCMFRVCYVNDGQHKFSAELINEKKD